MTLIVVAGSRLHTPASERLARIIKQLQGFKDHSSDETKGPIEVESSDEEPACPTSACPERAGPKQARPTPAARLRAYLDNQDASKHEHLNPHVLPAHAPLPIICPYVLHVGLDVFFGSGYVYNKCLYLQNFVCKQCLQSAMGMQVIKQDMKQNHNVLCIGVQVMGLGKIFMDAYASQL